MAVSFEDPATRQPVAHTTTVLRPDRFRIVIQTAEPTATGRMDGYASARTRVAQVIALTSHQLSRWSPRLAGLNALPQSAQP